MKHKHPALGAFFMQKGRMLLIEIKADKGTITITGHAGYAPPGNDIVCAAVSALTQTFIASVEQCTDDKIEYEIEPGNTVIKLWTLSEKSKTLLESFFIGCRMIEESYPANVRIEKERKKI